MSDTCRKHLIVGDADTTGGNCWIEILQHNPSINGDNQIRLLRHVPIFGPLQPNSVLPVGRG
jgi:hypothetical protein